MKKYLLLFLLLTVFGVLYFYIPSKPFENSPASDKDKFISISDKTFIKNGQPFFPIILNYIASIQTNKTEFWASPTKAYSIDSRHKDTIKETCLMQLKADMQLIKELGFNSVRIVGIGEEYIIDEVTGELGFGSAIGNIKDTTWLLSKKENYDKYLSAISELLQIVDGAGLKTILLLRMSVDVKNTEQHLGKVAEYFKNDTSILAIDVFNEPLYFDKPERSKQVVYEKMKEWKQIIKNSSPHRLVTIGLTGVREVMEWDPNILDVDFISYHPYEYEPEQVRNEMFWYGKYVKKPWIIGETAVPADNDSVSYDIQKIFAEQTIQQAYNCGAMGYSWWQYKDVNWHHFHADFMGMLNLRGITKTKNDLTVEGTIKPVAQAIKEFNSTVQKGKCECYDNYYNYSMKNDFRLTGKIIDKNGTPVDGAIVLGWNQYWSSSYHTVSKTDGTFELRGSYPFYHWMVSATQHSMVRGDVLPDTAKSNDGIPTINLGVLNLEKLSFLKE